MQTWHPRKAAERPLGAWESTAAHQRAIVLAAVGAIAAVLGRRADLLVIVAPLAVAAAWGLAVSPVPGSRVPSTARVPAASFGASAVGAVGAVSAVNFGGSVLPGNRVAPAVRESQRSRVIGLGGLPYWAVTTRSAAIASNAAAPVRLTALRSAQSGP